MSGCRVVITVIPRYCNKVSDATKLIACFAFSTLISSPAFSIAHSSLLLHCNNHSATINESTYHYLYDHDIWTWRHRCSSC